MLSSSIEIPWQIYPLIIVFVLLTGSTMALMVLVDKDMEKRGISRNRRFVSRYLGFWPSGVIRYLQESGQNKAVLCPNCGEATSVISGSGQRKCVHCKKEITDEQLRGANAVDREGLLKAIKAFYVVNWVAVAILIVFIVMFILL